MKTQPFNVCENTGIIDRIVHSITNIYITNTSIASEQSTQATLGDAICLQVTRDGWNVSTKCDVVKRGENKREMRKRSVIGKVRRNRIEERCTGGRESKRIMFPGAQGATTSCELDSGSSRIFIKFRGGRGASGHRRSRGKSSRFPSLYLVFVVSP